MYLSLCLAKYSGFMALGAHEGGTWDSIKGKQHISLSSLTHVSIHAPIHLFNQPLLVDAHHSGYREG